MKHLQNSVVKFCEVARSQENKGIDKYGQPLEPKDDYDWLEMAIEEQVDGFKYLHAEQVKRKWIIAKIRETMASCDLDVDEMINIIEYYLERLEGQ